MRNEFFVKHIRFTQTHIDILDGLIEKKPGINSYAEAVRYAVLSLKDDIDTESVERKMNVMSKNIDMLIEMIAGGFDAQNVKAIGDSEDTYIYKDAKKIVENKIQRATTIKSNLKKNNFKKEKPISKGFY
ncbi:hypothetical protein GOQ29_12785 [Clostridium sp. D2Q-14]|uniref:hypothetical protein n=1 Tax=Anaeromonas gelatinilytica TaxID=2683194 RepID=UPI00193C1DF0|nr:hypothetical protein [Anaeromonas gelatinilytica]MBS4536496.1 hypothetical protein [Anaeromonas gelatinilytica]